MMQRLLFVGSASFLAVSLLGCHDGALSLSYRDHRPVHVVEPAHVHVSHVCDRHCNHYWDGSTYIVVRGGHRHGPGCGHDWDGRRWVIVARTPVRAPHHAAQRDVHIRGPRGGEIHVSHTHGPNCGCAFDRRGNKWVVIGTSHVHGPGCGHVFIEGRWTIRF